MPKLNGARSKRSRSRKRQFGETKPNLDKPSFNIKLKEVEKIKVKSDHEIELEKYQQQRRLEREAYIKKEREKENTIKFEVVSPIKKDPNRGMRFIKCNNDPINRGRLGHSNTFLNDVKKYLARAKVISSIEGYIALSDTEKFNGKFRYSKFVGVIDESDISINSNLTSVTMRKDFYPQLNSTFYYEICYQNTFLDDDDPVLSSTGFVVSEYPNFKVYLEDRDGKIVLYRIDKSSGDKIILNFSQGDINYEKGEVILYDLTIIKGSFNDNRIELRVLPKSNDIVAKREVYLDVDVAKSKFQVYQE